MQRALRIGLVLTVLEGVALVALFAGPASWRPLALPVVAVSIGITIALFLWAIRSDRAALTRIAQAHPGSVVLRTGMAEESGLARADRGRVIVALADRNGISLRDRGDAEVLKVPADGILSLELGPLTGRSPLRPVRIERLDGPPVAFWAGSGPDQQLAAVVALRTALGRPVG